MGNHNVVTVPLGFDLVIEGVAYRQIAISTSGWIEFGGATTPSSIDASDWENESLPTAKHTNPFLAGFWDDTRVSPNNAGILYARVGKAPNRTFVVGFPLDRTLPANDDNHFTVELHEGSNLISVRYVTVEADGRGQGATIGFQGAGGAQAAAYPLTLNGAILDAARPDQGWSIQPTRAGGFVLAGITSSAFSLPAGSNDRLDGEDNVSDATLPFDVWIEGRPYRTLAISTNGWIEFGARTTVDSDPTNATLPTAKHQNPFLAVYWDNMRGTNGGIRWITVGDAPNRTFVVDFNSETATGADNFSQVQIHEGSNLISVRYLAAGTGGCGQSATIGFQGAGGAAARAYPLVKDGRILDATRIEHQGWSVHPVGSAIAFHASLAQAPAEITSAGVSGYGTVSTDDPVDVALPAGFTIAVDGVQYGTLTVSARGWIELGSKSNGEPFDDPTNVFLPASNHIRPLIAGYWDDFAPQESASVRYGYVGAVPNRVFLADFDLDRPGISSNDDNVQFQVQLHEGSNLINVQYRMAGPIALQPREAGNAAATIGFQGAGGAGATSFPLTFDGKVLASDRPNMGWSISPLPECGNSVVEPGEDCDTGSDACCMESCCPRPEDRCGNGAVDSGEACDDGLANGATCCSTSCQLRGPTEVCRPAAGPCDLEELCSGASPVCPVVDAKRRDVVCAQPSNNCSLAALCDGVSNACPQPPPDNGELCSDGDGCTVDDECAQGACRAGERVCQLSTPDNEFRVRLKGKRKRVPGSLVVECFSTTQGTCQAGGVFIDSMTGSSSQVTAGLGGGATGEIIAVGSPKLRKIKAGQTVRLKLRLNETGRNFVRGLSVGGTLRVVVLATVRNARGERPARLGTDLRRVK